MTAPAFPEALASARAELERAGHPADIAWLFDEDVVQTKRACYVRTPLADGQAAAEAAYSRALDRGSAVVLALMCRVEARSGVYVWEVRDEVSRMRAELLGLPAPFAVAAPKKVIAAQAISSGFQWFVLKAKWRLGLGEPAAIHFLPTRPR